MKQVEAGNTEAEKHGMTKALGVRDLTAFGIAAIIGAGIFSTIGKASFNGGPGVILLFLFTAVACSFAAFAYAEFASRVPVSGSAYTYSYVAFGEIFAWIIGWALIMEYAIGNITVAISWSDYFTSLINSIPNCHVPEWMTMDYFTAQTGYENFSGALDFGKARGFSFDESITILSASDLSGDLPKYLAWAGSPTIGNFHFILDIPAIGMIALITWLVYRGMKESRNASNIMVAVKLAVVLLVIAVGAFYVDITNWDPFLPNGFGGLAAGVSSVFFAYIGFDAISTTAEECKNPQRDLPRGIMYSIVICTILYVMIALVVTGMVTYKELNVGDPLAYVFSKFEGLKWLGGVIAISAVFAMASVFLVFQMGQPRIWMSMSRDGLLPKSFARLHPRFRTPAFATIVTGFLVGVPTLFLDLSFVVDVCSLGTLFAFVLVCAGVLKLEVLEKEESPAVGHMREARFRTPYLNSAFFLPPVFILTFVLTYYYAPGWLGDFFSYGEWDSFKHKVPMFIFFGIYAFMTVRCIIKKLSLIPVLGLLCCLYMMAQLGWKNWFLFTIWLVVGLVIYFGYSRKNSKLNVKH